DWQRREMANGFILWGKGMDTFGPVGPVVDTSIDASDLRITLKVNGELKQDSRTSDLLFDVPHLVSELSKAFTFEPGDLIMTGTPSGVGPIKRATSWRSRSSGSACSVTRSSRRSRIPARRNTSMADTRQISVEIQYCAP